MIVTVTRSKTFPIFPETRFQFEHRDHRPPPQPAQTVFGFPARTWVVTHWNFAHPKSGSDREGRNEALHQFHREKRLANLAAHHAQLAARIVNTILEHGSANHVCDS